MKVTISVIKADIGSIGGHICPSQRLIETVNYRELNIPILSEAFLAQPLPY